ncbi:hypothetical protein [Streptomyces sp. SP18CS02]|nr:hypothetical protein [Streptomyces sp. SP18CS02]MEE1754438.1 hypothetical protein [Streptomyces sp. SP18CS02]
MIRVQQDIPAGRNPFAYFKRAITSVPDRRVDRADRPLSAA